MAPVGMDDFQQEALQSESTGAGFTSAEARFAYERARRLRTVLKTAGALLGLVAFGFFMYWLGGGFRDHAGQAGADGHVHGSQCALGTDPIGSPEAKVKATVILPLESDCHNNIITFLQEIARARPHQIRAEFYTMEEYGKTKLSQEIGMICAAVMVNGQTTFDVVYDGDEHRVSLIGTEPTHYTLGDIGEAITAVFIEQYGDPGEPLYTVEEGSEFGKATGEEGIEGTPEERGVPEGMELPGFRELNRRD